MIELLLQAERLLVHGMVDQAESIYLRAIEQDPQNAIAVVGLARVALERGDDRLAYEQACAALEIDRQNVAALRLEARLSEVFATRGEPFERPAWLDSGTPPLPAPAAPPAAPPPAETATPATTEARPSERFVFDRNPTMADHRRRDEGTEPADRSDRPATPAPSPAEAPPPPAQRSGLLRRLRGR